MGTQPSGTCILPTIIYSYLSLVFYSYPIVYYSSTNHIYFESKITSLIWLRVVICITPRYVILAPQIIRCRL
jgi:hypothetical protein